MRSMLPARKSSFQLDNLGLIIINILSARNRKWRDRALSGTQFNVVGVRIFVCQYLEVIDLARNLAFRAKKEEKGPEKRTFGSLGASMTK